MTWAAFNALLSSARPVWLYRLTINNVAHYYTSRSRNYTTPAGAPNSTFLGSQEWTSLSVSFSRIRETRERRKRDVTITFPYNTQPLLSILGSEVDIPIRVEIWQGFEGDPDNEFVAFFVGAARQVRPTLRTLRLICADVSAELDTYGISRVVQVPCPYAVFDTQCRLDESSFELSGTANAVNGLVVTVPGASGEVDTYFRAGTIEYDGVRQVIAQHVGNDITLIGPFPALTDEITTNGSAAVTLLPGCRKSLSYCEGFNNTINHGGFPWITDSPYDGNGIL